ncbi:MULTISPECIES: DNA polymerase III subunit gamma/tau [Streptococcus]|jgi:DNA polymerase III, subunit gamma and tau|uniref:DNA polymerase III subunit gamma/tau n=2 Tax=Bacteria TaxID=2 RepID=A0A1S0Z9R5_SALET|nr:MULTISPECIES: DNA polymerase III subunit gamma/tau [Streptococcus]ANR76011.1 DNA polymerase III subunit gamma/tau [Streptococcus sp. oral taxon 064]ATF56582.1 DNA polymerase III subunit gamma/tau [Streptococcus oralis]EMG34826.1 DNA polymerase III subunits gamma and tau [Streptococcus oralis subsp. tigurinus 1366]EPX88500.1 DNA polymerase III subunit gamma/tau [Streptococcus oralis subsp. tigurinus 2426]EPX89278.1 DNA polymerase III subunit gamma/tau [Streptococcus oralis subsp. tigurinus 2
MYQALYRKYRSQTFSQLVGQEVVAKTLKQAVEQEKISHAYLFSGPRGTGKTSVAKIFAKAMNCPNQVDGEPCNNCYICQAVTEGSLEDVIEMDAASNNGVDEIREIRDKSTYAPSLARYKVYIIDEVHMLSTGAFNALLKTLEEPTQNVIFILATTELHKIPATILSRVQRFEFKSIRTQDITAHIHHILEKENISSEPEAVEIIARRAEGGMRDALSILDQALSLTQGNALTTAISEEITGTISLSALDDYVAALSQQDVSKALDSLNLLFENGKSMTRFVTDLLQYLRDLLVVQTGGENTHHSPVFMDNLALSQESLFEMIRIATVSLADMKASLQPKIYAEMMTIRLAEIKPESALSGAVESEISTLRQEVARLKQELANVGAAPKQVVPVPSRPATSKTVYRVDRNKVQAILQEAVENPDLARQNLIRLQNAWGEVIESLAGPDKALLVGSQPVAANEHHAILAFESNFNAGQTMKRDNLNTMFGNILSQAAGFSPEILAISLEEWKEVRAAFSAKNKSSQADQEVEEESLIPEGFEFLADKVMVEED